MKYRNPVIIAGIAACILALLSCQKEVDRFIPLEEEAFTLDFSALTSSIDDTAHFSISGLVEQRIHTPAGRQFHFIPGIFEYRDGSDCVCESIRLEIIELKTKRDYLVHQKPTASGHHRLISAGAFHIAAFDGFQPLKLKAGKTLSFSVPSDRPDFEMALFYGEELQEGFTWVQADQQAGTMTSVQVVERQSDSAFFIGYDCITARLAWINIDKLADNGEANPVCVSVDSLTTHRNTVVFAVLVDELSILSMSPTDDRKYCLRHLPVGARVIFMGVRQLAKDEYEMALKETEIGSDYHVNLEFVNVTLEEIKSALDDL